MTLHDVLEALVGDIPTVDEEADSDAVQRPDGSWLLDGGISIERLKDILSLEDALPDEDEAGYHTLGGFVMAMLENVPKTGDTFEWASLKFEVVDIDRNRVDKILVTPLKPVAPPTAAEPHKP